MTTYKTIDEIKQANEDAGQCWFSPSSMKFFRSKVHSPVYEGNFFVSSEQASAGHPRLFSVRYLDENGHVKTKGKFQRYTTLVLARRVARRAYLDDEEEDENLKVKLNDISASILADVAKARKILLRSREDEDTKGGG